jgi:hypothetical protein
LASVSAISWHGIAAGLTAFMFRWTWPGMMSDLAYLHIIEPRIVGGEAPVEGKPSVEQP